MAIENLHKRARLVTAVLLVFVPVVATAQVLEVVAKSGDNAPDENGTFSTFTLPALNNNGQTAFHAKAAGTTRGTQDDDGIYRGEASVGTVSQIAREKPARLNSSGLNNLEQNPALNSSGELAFLATFVQPLIVGGDSFRGVYRGSSDGLTAIAVEGDAAPFGDGIAHFTNVRRVRLDLNAAGEVAFGAEVTGNKEGIFAGSGGNVRLIVGEDEVTPDGDRTYSSFGALTLNDVGDVAFRANLSHGRGGIYRHSGDTVTRVVREGQASPNGMDFFNSVAGTALSNTGDVAFRGVLQGTSGGTDDDEGIYLGDDGTVSELAREGSPGAGGLGLYGRILNVPIVNNIGQVAFQTGGIKPGIFRAQLSGATPLVTPLARAGDTVPSGDTIADFAQNMAFNLWGQAAFVSQLNDPTSDEFALVLADGIDVIEVARTGQIFDGNTITSLDLARGAEPEGNERSGLNDEGQVAFRAAFDNGDQAIIRFSLIPKLQWKAKESGPFYSPIYWTEQLVPTSFHDVVIDPVSEVTVSGEATKMHVRSLTIGATETGIATLDLSHGGDFRALEEVTINEQGQINIGAGHYLSAAEMTNRGTLKIQDDGYIKIIGAAPQGSPGSPTDGDYVQEADGTLNIDLARPVSEMLKIYGQATLGGTLALSLSEGYAPRVGDAFGLISAEEGISGRFASILLPEPYDWLVTFGDNDVKAFIQSPLGDCNDDGLVTGEDLTCTCADVVGGLQTILDTTGLVQGDLDADGEVAFADFLVLSAHFGQSRVGYTDGDLDCDGEVAFADFLIFSANFGKTGGAAAASNVPEPVALEILALVFLPGLMLRPRRNSLANKNPSGARQ